MSPNGSAAARFLYDVKNGSAVVRFLNLSECFKFNIQTDFVMSTGNTLLAFLAGAAAGAVAALLLAPDSGENTRAKICSGAKGVADKAKEMFREHLDDLEATLEEE